MNMFLKEVSQRLVRMNGKCLPSAIFEVSHFLTVFSWIPDDDVVEAGSADLDTETVVTGGYFVLTTGRFIHRVGGIPDINCLARFDLFWEAGLQFIDVRNTFEGCDGGYGGIGTYVGMKKGLECECIGGRGVCDVKMGGELMSGECDGIGEGKSECGFDGGVRVEDYGGKIYEGGVLLKWRRVRTEADGDGIASVYEGSIERPYLVACKAVLG